jgi:hypothetical protein
MPLFVQPVTGTIVSEDYDRVNVRLMDYIPVRQTAAFHQIKNLLTKAPAQSPRHGGKQENSGSLPVAGRAGEGFFPSPLIPIL